jgi:hypothetical protein
VTAHVDLTRLNLNRALTVLGLYLGQERGTNKLETKMKITKLILATLATVVIANMAQAGQLFSHYDNEYLSSDREALVNLIEVRDGWRSLIDDQLHEGWLFKLRDGSKVNVIKLGDEVSTVLGTNGNIFYIATSGLK